MHRKSGLALSILAGCAWSQAPEKVDFAKQIQPIFSESCAKCHGEKRASAKMRLHTAAALKEKWDAEKGLIVAGKSPMADMAYDAHHLARTDALDPEALPYRLLFSERVLCQNLVDYDDGLAVDPILVIEESALAQRDAHDAQIIRRHARCQRDRHLVRWRRSGRSPVAKTVVTFAHRDDIGKRHRLHSGYAAGAIQDVPKGRTDLGWTRERAWRKAQASHQHVPGVNAGVKG